MAYFIKYSLIVTCVVLVLTGCSGGSGPFVPGTEPGPFDISNPISDRNATESNHVCLFYSLIYIDATNPDEIKFEIVPLRAGSIHMNILKFLETGICIDCFKIVGFNFPKPGVLDVDIEITHPFTDLHFTVFDVRGIMMFNGSHIFPASGLTMSDSSMGDGELLNAEGYTQLYNGSTLGMAGDLQTYFKGKFATSTVPNADLNGFIRHITDDPENTRNALYPADSVTQTYSLALPAGEFVLGYAVDASWDIPVVEVVEDPMTDFPITANCIEPWKIDVTAYPVGDGLTEKGGYVNIVMFVYDWQGKSSHAAPIVECPELFDGAVSAAWVEDFDGFTRYEATIGNTKLASHGNYRCLISVEDNENASSPEWMEWISYSVVNLNVADPPGGWARTWGGSYYEPYLSRTDHGYGVAIDSEGNVYVTGCFYGIVDFDAGWGYDPHTSNGTSDVFLSKFDNDGYYEWTLTWGGPGWERGYGVAVDGSGNIYVTGSFWGKVEFNPGSGLTAWHTSNGELDAFVSKFDSSGNFEWAHAWGGENYDIGRGVAIDGSGNVYVTGFFEDTVDFDPGGGDPHTSNGSEDVFLSKFDTSGNFEWARTWGGLPTYYGQGDRGYGVAADSFGNVYVTGEFRGGTVDFNPGGGDPHTSNGGTDALLSKFGSLGNFEWARTWGGSSTETGYGVAIDGSGNVYVTGDFGEGAVDFDPGGGDPHTSYGETDAFLSKFDSSGYFEWARTWGGSGTETGYGVAADGSGNVYVTGSFEDTVDFDPGGGDPHTSLGYENIFLSKFESSGNFEWVRTWGGEYYYDHGYGVTADASGNVFTTGIFGKSVDFAPTDPPCNEDSDWHTSKRRTDVFLTKHFPNGCW